MKRTKNCKYCHETFESRRRNHLYCCTSCKTMASYKRNNYKYVAGHYQKDNSVQIKTADSIKNPDKKVDGKLNPIRPEKEGINLISVSNAALGTATSNSIAYGLKKVFAPNTLPATKGDVDNLRKEIENLKFLLRMRFSIKNIQ